jgi:Flp pilus assembly secretin CpaC
VVEGLTALLVVGVATAFAARGARAGRSERRHLACDRPVHVVLTQPAAVERISIANPEVADAIVVSPREVLVNGIALGTTSLIIWDAGRRPPRVLGRGHGGCRPARADDPHPLSAGADLGDRRRPTW